MSVADDQFTLNDSIALLETGAISPTNHIAGHIVRGAALALRQADGQPSAINDIRKGLQAIEALFKLRGSQLVDTNRLVAQRVRTERKLGTTIRDGKEEGRFREGRPSETITRDDSFSLRDIGLTPNQSMLFQRLALIAEDELEEWMHAILQARSPSRELSTNAVLANWERYIREREKAQRRARMATLPKADPNALHGAEVEVADARSLPLADDSVDLIVTSPPYGLAIDYEEGDVPPLVWRPFMLDWLKEAYRVTKPSGRLALNVPLDTSEPYPRPTYVEAVLAALRECGEPEHPKRTDEPFWRYRFTIIWNEGNTTKGGWALGSQSSARKPWHVSQSECIAVFGKGEWGPSSTNDDDITPDEFLLAGRGPWEFSGESRPWEGHPAAFPLELPRRLIPYLCRVGDTVLDPFCGSGTTLVAAMERGRRAFGYDISAAYVESARRRLLEVR